MHIYIQLIQLVFKPCSEVEDPMKRIHKSKFLLMVLATQCITSGMIVHAVPGAELAATVTRALWGGATKVGNAVKNNIVAITGTIGVASVGKIVLTGNCDPSDLAVAGISLGLTGTISFCKMLHTRFVTLRNIEKMLESKRGRLKLYNWFLYTYPTAQEAWQKKDALLIDLKKDYKEKTKRDLLNILKKEKTELEDYRKKLKQFARLFDFGIHKSIKKAINQLELNPNKPELWTTEQATALDNRIKPSCRNGLIYWLLLRLNYGKAAKLYWEIYKRLERLKVIEDIVKSKQWDSMQNPVYNALYVLRQSVNDVQEVIGNLREDVSLQVKSDDSQAVCLPQEHEHEIKSQLNKILTSINGTIAYLDAMPPNHWPYNIDVMKDECNKSLQDVLTRISNLLVSFQPNPSALIRQTVLTTLAGCKQTINGLLASTQS